MRLFLLTIAVAFLGTLSFGCPKQEFLPWCNDPAHPCPEVEPDYPSYPAPGQAVVVEKDDTPAALASPCGKACANLLVLSCQEGKTEHGVTCYRACLSQAQHTRVPVLCWTNAKTPAAARACGGLTCPLN